VEGVDRTYLLYVPASYRGEAPAAIVFDFHGFGSSAAQQIAYGNFRPLADRDGFIVVAPDGQGMPRHFTLLGPGPGEVDDVTMTLALLDHLEATLCVDAGRVYGAGMSNGGAFSAILACRAADRFSAVAAVAAVVLLPGCAGRPVPVVAFQGTADPIVPFGGGTVRCCGSPQIPAASDTMQQWADHDGCAAPTESHPSPSITQRAWGGCTDGADVVFYVVDGGGHTWPGSAFDVAALGATTKEIDASDTIWTFFKAHAR